MPIFYKKNYKVKFVERRLVVMANLINPEIVNSNSEVSVDFSSFTSDSAAIIPADPGAGAPKKRGRPPKNKNKKMPDGTVLVLEEEVSEEPLAMWQSNQPYMDSYNETTGILRGAIFELDELGRDVREQYEAVKDSKTMRNKYGIIKDLADTRASIIGNKIRAVQEINSTITKAHDLDMKRYKDNKQAQLAAEANSDQKIFDMYNAFINTPVGVYNANAPQFPTMQEMTLPSTGIIGAEIGPINADPAYAAYKQRETPEQQIMIMQKNNPNIKTVVVYNQANQTKRFEVRDTATGEVIPGAPVPADFILADTNVNIANMVARNANIDAVYPLVLEGSPNSLLDF